MPVGAELELFELRSILKQTERELVSAGRVLPNLDGLVARAGCDPAIVGAEGDGFHALSVRWKVIIREDLAIIQPNSEELPAICTDDRISVGRIDR